MISKELLNNRADFEKFLTYLQDFSEKLGYSYDRKKSPYSYPCVVVLWDGEDSSPYHDFTFVYPSDLYPMLQ